MKELDPNMAMENEAQVVNQPYLVKGEKFET